MAPRLDEFGYELEKLVSGLAIDAGKSTIAHELLHMAFDGAGKIITTGTFFGSILKIDPVTGEILSLIGTLDQPVGIAIASNGDIYVTNFADGTLNRFPAGAGPSQIVGTIPPGVSANTVALNASEDKAYVTAAFFSSGLYEFDISNPGLFPVPPVTKFGVSALHGFFGIAFAPGSDQQLYLANQTGILQLVPDVTLVTPTLVTQGGPVSVFAMAFRGADLWMVDLFKLIVLGTATAGEIRSFNVSTFQFTTEANVPSSVGITEGFALDAGGDAYVVGVEESKLTKYDVSEDSFTIIRNPVVNSPADMALQTLSDGSVRLYPQDFTKITFIDGATGKRTGLIPTIVGGNFNVLQPQSCAAEGATVLNASWAGLGLLRLINADSLVILFQSTQLPTKVLANGDFLDTTNFVAVTYDFGFINPAIYRLPRDNSAGVIIPSTMVQPVGLLVVANTNGPDLYVSDFSAGKIVQLMDNGANVNVDRVTGLSKPKGLWLDNRSPRFAFTMEVPSSGVGRITRWDRVTGGTSLFIDGIPVGLRDPAPISMAPWFQLNGGICDPKGNMFFNSNVPNEVWAARVTPCGQLQRAS